MKDRTLEPSLTGRRAIISLAGKMGEFAQGVLDGDPFLFTAALVSSPFAACIQAKEGGKAGCQVRHHCHPGETSKTEALLKALGAKWGAVDERIDLQIWNPAGLGKGLGSSTVDMAGAAMAYALWLGRDLDDLEIYRELCRIERSDFITRPGDLMFANPATGDAESRGKAPDLILVAWDDDPAGSIDTGRASVFDGHRKNHQAEYRDIVAALESGDLVSFLRGSTFSAEINNRYLPKTGFRFGRQLARAVSGGLVAAHTGTWMAVACDDADQASWLASRLLKGGAKSVITSMRTGSIINPANVEVQDNEFGAF